MSPELSKKEQLRAFERALAVNPRDVLALVRMGNLYQDLHELEEAEKAYRTALKLLPEQAELHSNLGNALRGQGKLTESIAVHRQAISLNPRYALGYVNLGNALMDSGDLLQAEAQFRTALWLDANLVLAHNNLGYALWQGGRMDEAVAHLRRSIEIKPTALACVNLANALRDQGEAETALQYSLAAVELEPESPVYHSNLCYAMWFHPGLSVQEVLHEHRRFSQRHEAPLVAQRMAPVNNRDPNRRLRVGYVSPDFRMHPLALLLEPVLANHDRDAFEIYCYSDVTRGDEVTARMKTYAHVWRETVALSHEQMAQLIREDQIDILVDLTAHMNRNRLMMFARKAAPIQVTYLAYPATTGLAAMDYAVTDSFLDPADSDGQYTEKLLRIPGCYWCYRAVAGSPPVVEAPCVRNGYATFGSLNSLTKVNAEVIRVWGRILDSVPNSRLMLLVGEAMHNRTVIANFARGGIAEERLQLVSRRPREQYLALYNEIDITLDPFPYNGHTTSIDSLWMGVPVVTLRGDRAVSRGGGSLLSNIGLREWIAETPKAYVELAVKLASDSTQLNALRNQLRQRLQKSPVMAEQSFTRNLEVAFRTIWRKWCEQGAG